MEMTEEEIRRDYRLAKFPDKQVRILAEMNGVTPKVIRRIIAGEDVVQAASRRRPKCAYVRKTNNITWTVDKLDELRRLRDQGYRLKEIADMLGYKLRTVQSICTYYAIYKPGYVGKRKSRK